LGLRFELFHDVLQIRIDGRLFFDSLRRCDVREVNVDSWRFCCRRDLLFCSMFCGSCFDWCFCGLRLDINNWIRMIVQIDLLELIVGRIDERLTIYGNLIASDNRFKRVVFLRSRLISLECGLNRLISCLRCLESRIDRLRRGLSCLEIRIYGLFSYLGSLKIRVRRWSCDLGSLEVGIGWLLRALGRLDRSLWHWLRDLSRSSGRISEIETKMMPVAMAMPMTVSVPMSVIVAVSVIVILAFAVLVAMSVTVIMTVSMAMIVVLLMIVVEMLSLGLLNDGLFSHWLNILF
jgi:hypothetical protein